jgi:hypothetical protein
MIHEAECHIVLEPGMGLPGFLKAEPPIPTDQQIEEVFPNWQLKVKPFVQRCCKEENKDINHLTANDLFRYGMKFMVCESTKIL